MKKKISRKQALFVWVTYLIAGILLFASFLLGTGSARPATFEGSNFVPLLLIIVVIVPAVVYFRVWLRLRP